MVENFDQHESPRTKNPEGEKVFGETEEERAHRRLERDANKAAKRASERMRKDEEGHGEFSNIGSV